MGNLGQIIKRECEKYQLNPLLVAAVIWQESKGDPWAHRYEPKFYDRYLRNKPKDKVPGLWPPGCDHESEATARASSFGLMQIMGQVAREMGFRGRYLTELCSPEINLTLGIKKLAGLLEREGDVEQALLKWNGGGNPDYPKEVLAKLRTGEGNHLLLAER